MALFGSSKKKKESAVAPRGEASARTSGRAAVGIAHILKAPRITEKATVAQSASVYVFNIKESATKRDVIAAVKKTYGVSPRKVRVAAVPRKEVRHMRTGRYGVAGGGKKAYVYLKSGDIITVA